MGISLPVVIDLFAGAGGLSLGAARAGFKIAAAIDSDPFAIWTHGVNFPKSNHFDHDIQSLGGSELLKMSGLSPGGLHGLIGGPPCQGFSAIGKGDISDPRNTLFKHFFRLVKEVKPAFFLAENVPGILASKYDDIRIAAFKEIPGNYHVLNPIQVVASDYGVPTGRKRVFFIGYDPKRFSSPISEETFNSNGIRNTIFVGEALSGLPTRIDGRWIAEELGWRPTEHHDHNYFFKRVVGCIPPGLGDPMRLLRFMERKEVSGCLGTRHSAEVRARYRALKIGEMDRISRSIKLDPYGFCPTLRAGTSKEKGSYQAVRPIHFKSPRVITPREAGRLQGFPDWFYFHPTKWHSFRQIGNSVSPLLAEEVLSRITPHILC